MKELQKIIVNNLKKSYKGKTVLEIPKLEISTGSFVGIIGKNGAGKTTFFNLVLDLVKPEEGYVKIDNFIVKNSENWKRTTGASMDSSFLIPYYTTEEMFSFILNAHKVKCTNIYEKTKLFIPLFEDEILSKQKYISEFSAGNQQKISIAAAMIAEPKLLILDEPFANLDPTGQKRLLVLLQDYHKKTNCTIMLSSHNIQYTRVVCNRIILLEKGKIIEDSLNTVAFSKKVENYFE